MTKLGRPPIAVKERKSHLIALRLKPAEYKIVEAAAQKAGLSVSAYIRTILGLRGKQ